MSSAPASARRKSRRRRRAKPDYSRQACPALARGDACAFGARCRYSHAAPGSWPQPREPQGAAAVRVEQAWFAHVRPVARPSGAAAVAQTSDVSIGARFVEQFNLHERFELTACWDASSEAQDRFRSTENVVETPEDVITNCDVVYIAVPPAAHANPQRMTARRAATSPPLHRQ